MRILFMGTPDFALFSLRAMIEAGEEIIGVVTQPDKPKGRGYAMMPPPVKVYAEAQGIPVYQPNTLRGAEFEALLTELAPELIVVVAYGKILPQNVLEFPKHGCINVHGSLLPEYRGAAPMQRAILEGKRTTGVTTMKMDVGLDTGDVMLTEKVTIEENDNFESVHDKLVVAGSQGLLKAIELFKSGKATFTPQGEEFTYAEKITKADCLIDFSKSAWEVHNQIRGLSPIPLAYTKTPDGKILKVTRAHIAEKSANADTGTVVFLDNCICVKCGDGVIALDEVIPEGKGRMSAQSYINGRKISAGDILG